MEDQVRMPFSLPSSSPPCKKPPLLPRPRLRTLPLHACSAFGRRAGSEVVDESDKVTCHSDLSDRPSFCETGAVIPGGVVVVNIKILAKHVWCVGSSGAWIHVAGAPHLCLSASHGPG